MINNITKRIYSMLLVLAIASAIPLTTYASSSSISISPHASCTNHSWIKLNTMPYTIYLCIKCGKTSKYRF